MMCDLLGMHPLHMPPYSMAAVLHTPGINVGTSHHQASELWHHGCTAQLLQRLRSHQLASCRQVQLQMCLAAT